MPIKHGSAGNGRRTTEYHSWMSMKSRCLRPTHNRYHRYGGRGIKICDRWLESFANFLSDMGEKPEGHSLGRIDNDGPYSPENCRWETFERQMRNTAVSRMFTLNGVTKNINDWSQDLGIPLETLRWRRKQGWPVERILSKNHRPSRPSS